ncbi:hypothetical protein [Desulfotruncus arcticus]|uniref:hypothetical protein n=1 Tax=Desulfotruncus arcticus TaxID=341036 RepID=UPI001EE4D984|nr:hypothetical protein [Desulfotruncus arcticus]
MSAYPGIFRMQKVGREISVKYIIVGNGRAARGGAASLTDNLYAKLFFQCILEDLGQANTSLGSFYVQPSGDTDRTAYCAIVAYSSPDKIYELIL